MSETIQVKLTNADDVILKESDKAQCFFVGKPGQATNACFEKAFEITHSEWPKNVTADFEIGERKFQNLSCTKGKAIAKAKGMYQLKKHPDGTMYLSMKVDYPARDSYDKMYAGAFERVIYRENGEVVVIQAKYGHVLPKINVYIGLKESVPYLDALLEVLDNADAYQMTLLKKYALCVAQKYRLSDEQAEQIENFIIYTCLDAANITAAFGIFKSRKRSLSYELLKVVADTVCGLCFFDWYRTAPRRRYEVLGELTDYVRRLQRGKGVVWNNNERAYCHFIRHHFDAEVFADVYTVSLVLLRFLAENDIGDLDSFKRQAGAPGIISATLMADTVDALSSAQLSSEVKKLFFSLLGTNPQGAKENTEKALYRLHTATNSLFRAIQAVTVYALPAGSRGEEQAAESAIEKATLSAAAAVALSVKKQGGAEQQDSQGKVQEHIAAMCQSIAAQYGVRLGAEDDKAFAAKALMRLADAYLEEENGRMLNDCKRHSYEFTGEFLPENSFVFVYIIAFLLLQLIWHAGGDSESLRLLLRQVSPEDELITREQLAALITEAKYRFGAMCGTDLLESMSN